MTIFPAILRRLRNMCIVIAVLSAALVAYVASQTGWQYRDVSWQWIEALPDNLAQPALPQRVRGKFVRLRGFSSPFDTILIAGGQSQSCVMLLPPDDPSQAAWAEIHRQLEPFETERARLQKVADDPAADASLEAKLNSIRRNMLALVQQAGPNGNRTDAQEIQASVLRLQLNEALARSALRRAAHEASTLFEDLTKLQLPLTRKPVELMPASGVLLIYRDGGERADRDRAREPDPFISARHEEYEKQQRLIRDRQDRFIKDTLRVPPAATMISNERAQLTQTLKHCGELIDSIRGVLPAELIVEGRLQAADPELRQQYKQLLGHDPPRFLILAGEMPPDRALMPLLWLAGVCLLVAVACATSVKYCFRVRSAEPSQ